MDIGKVGAPGILQIRSGHCEIDAHFWRLMWLHLRGWASLLDTRGIRREVRLCKPS